MPEISGFLSFEQPSGDQPLFLGVASEAKACADAAASAPKLMPMERRKIELELTGEAFAKSLVGHPAQVTVEIDGVEVCRHLLVAAAHGEAVRLGPLLMSEKVFADFIGTVTFTLTVENEYGVSAVGTCDPVYLQPVPSADNNRLLKMLEAVKQAASLLTQPVNASGAEKTEAKKESDVAEYFSIIERIVGAFARELHYFEKSARFRLQQSTRLTALSRVENVTHRTLEFIATHPEELIETTNPAGIRFQGRRYLPGRTLDVTNKKSFDIYENRCLVGFLKTVLHTAQALEEKMDELFTEEAVEEKGELARAQMRAPLQNLVAAYARCFDIEDAVPLAGLPQPSAVFISSMAYRPFYELMQAWFALKPPAYESLRFYVTVSKSSRLYEYYVLLQLIKAMGAEPEAKWRINWPAFGGRVVRDPICNVFQFQKEAAEVTIFYEPRLSAGIVEEENDIGLVRTMVMECDAYGEPLKDPKSACWTPDFVVRIKEGDRTRYWIADAKYATWPTAVRFYANEAMRKYLLQTSPRRPNETVEGLTLFCGKKLAAESGARSLRNVDANVQRTPTTETFVLTGEEDAARLKPWLDGLLGANLAL